MPVSDDSAFSIADEALWSALQADATLLAWRQQQSESGTHPGKDFDEGELPQLEAIRKTDCPALIVTTRGSVGTGDRRPDYEGALYPVAILGLLWRSAKEVEQGKKVKRFAELVRNVVVAQRATCFSGHVTANPNPIRSVEVDAIDFPQFEADSTTAAFAMVVTFELDVPVS